MFLDETHILKVSLHMPSVTCFLLTEMCSTGRCTVPR